MVFFIGLKTQISFVFQTLEHLRLRIKSRQVKIHLFSLLTVMTLRKTITMKTMILLQVTRIIIIHYGFHHTDSYKVLSLTSHIHCMSYTVIIIVDCQYISKFVFKIFSHDQISLLLEIFGAVFSVLNWIKMYRNIF